MEYLSRTNPSGNFRPPIQNFDDFNPNHFPHPNNEMVYNSINRMNQNNAFLVPCEFMFQQLIPPEMNRGHNATLQTNHSEMPPHVANGFGHNQQVSNSMVPSNPTLIQDHEVNGMMMQNFAPPHASASNNSNFCCDDTMYVSSKHCGRIIGKNGVKIKEIQDSTGAKLKIHSQEEPVNGQTRVTINGNEEQRVRCRQIITDIITDSERRYGHQSETNGFTSQDKPTANNNAYSSKPLMFKNHDIPNYPDRMCMPPDTVQFPTSPQKYPISNGNFMDNHTNSYNNMNTWPGGNSSYKTNYEEDLSKRFKNMMKTKVDHSSYPIVKHFYVATSEIANMTPQQRDQFFLDRQNILVPELMNKSDDRTPCRIPNPITTFHQAFHRHPYILSLFQRHGFTEPTPIQCMAWPILMSGLDFIGIAQTGTGKTLAFLLPGFIHLEGQTKPRNQRAGPTVLILSPTRELAQQIMNEADRFSYHGIRCVCVYGGADRRSQMRKLEDGCDVVVATPGRLNDLLDSGRISLSDVSYLVLDEADRMLDMGFEPQVVKALTEVRSDRQTVMTSATWPLGVKRISENYMQNPVQVNIGNMNLNACHDVIQRVEIIEEENKEARLFHFIKTELLPGEKALVFVLKKADCSTIASAIQRMPNAPNATHIHGDLDQPARERALERLRCGEVQILVATDLASRGLDIKDIAYVFNYDFPKNIEEYVHRVGRTGRAGRSGISISLLTRVEWRHAEGLISIMEEANQIVPPELRALADRTTRQDASNRNRRNGNIRGAINSRNGPNNLAHFSQPMNGMSGRRGGSNGFHNGHNNGYYMNGGFMNMGAPPAMGQHMMMPGFDYPGVYNARMPPPHMYEPYWS